MCVNEFFLTHASLCFCGFPIDPLTLDFNIFRHLWFYFGYLLFLINYYDIKFNPSNIWRIKYTKNSIKLTYLHVLTRRNWKSETLLLTKWIFALQSHTRFEILLQIIKKKRDLITMLLLWYTRTCYLVWPSDLVRKITSDSAFQNSCTRNATFTKAKAIFVLNWLQKTTKRLDFCFPQQQ